MYRFLLPAFVMIGAIVVLLAGALGGVPSLPDLTGGWTAYFTNAAPEHAATPGGDNTHVASVPPPAAPTASNPPPAPTAPNVPANQSPAPDALRQQAARLQGQIAQRSRELASLNSSEDQARHELDALHQQRQTEEAAISQLQAQRKQMAAAASHEKSAPQSASTPSGNPPIQAASVPPRAKVQYPRRQAQPTSSRRVASKTKQTRTPQGDLENARYLLASGRAADARQMLVLAQAQSQLSPVTPDQPSPTGGSVAATRISEAIRYLDRGDTRFALREINMAMNNTATAARTWPAYSSSSPQRGHYQSPPAYYDGNGRR